MIPHRILPDALAELDAAASWYEEQREGLGLELVAEYEKRLALALETPQVGTLAGKTSRGNQIFRYRLERFTRYAILMATIEGVSTVLAFEHSSRRPGSWRDRL
jgi:toxin ParE1/3/4